ncbi:hypothetical protein N7530_008284 [Penicillium desertorum]|uniref:Uncharacterized protein n=1 Tax=Penicillium desertorum TaxID=1303715 RepID=A0A9W9WPL2_9EURO|nr:hypothetical protein N7530_008284 [Penicillium desertorum]
MLPFRDILTNVWKSTGQPIKDINGNICNGQMVSLAHSVNLIYKGRRPGCFFCVPNKSNVAVFPQVHSKKLIIDNDDKACRV